MKNINCIVSQLRSKFLAPSLKTFQAYDKPLILTKGKMQYMWDNNNKKYIDLLGQNLTISVGHCHPKVVNPAINQMKTCITKFPYVISMNLFRHHFIVLSLYPGVLGVIGGMFLNRTLNE